MAISSTPNSIVKHPRDTYSQQQTWVSNDKKQYYHKTSALAVILLESKIIVNSTISTPGAKFYTIGVKDFFLSSTLPQAEYMKININEMTQDIINKIKLQDLKDNNRCVHFRIAKGL